MRARWEVEMQAIVGGLAAFAVVVGWVLLRWRSSGRDPSYLDDPSILLPAPPEGMTAATATIVDGGHAATAFMAGLFDLASRDEIAFRDETPDARGAHHVGIEIHGGLTDDPRILLNRRRPVGEGEAWLLANLKTFAAGRSGQLGGTGEGLAAIAAMSEFSSFIVGALTAGAGDTAQDGLGTMGGGTLPGDAPDLEASVAAALTRAGRPVPETLRGSIAGRAPMIELVRQALKDPGAILADPQAFASRVEATTGHTITPEEMDSLTTWLHEQGVSADRAGSPPTGTGAGEAYISADDAVRFHPPLGFGTFVENYARRKGWIAGLSFVSRWKWHGLAIAEVIVGLLTADAGVDQLGLIYGAGLGIAAGGLATWFIAPFMASRTHEGAVMKAQLAAYRRTLKATFDSAATLDDAVTASKLAWLETPDQALVWGVALGLRPEIEALLRRTTSGIAAGTVAGTAFLPRWIGRASQVVSAVASQIISESATRTSSTGTVHDYAAVFAGIERIGTATA